LRVISVKVEEKLLVELDEIASKLGVPRSVVIRRFLVEGARRFKRGRSSDVFVSPRLRIL